MVPNFDFVATYLKPVYNIQCCQFRTLTKFSLPN